MLCKNGILNLQGCKAIKIFNYEYDFYLGILNVYSYLPKELHISLLNENYKNIKKYINTTSCDNIGGKFFDKIHDKFTKI